jgi:hypothetical protein
LKDRLTVIVCANLTGTCAIPLQVLSEKVIRTFTVSVQVTPSGWNTNQAFCEWVKRQFIPIVNDFKRLNDQHGDVLLLLDNHRSHSPPAKKKTTVLPMHHGLKYEFLPARTSALIQPMDQGIIRSMKCLYLAKLEEEYASQREHVEYEDFFRAVNPAKACELLNECWPVASATLQNGWKRILGTSPIETRHEDEQEDEEREEGEEEQEESEEEDGSSSSDEATE